MRQIVSGATTLRLLVFMGLSAAGQCLRVSGVLVPSAVKSGSTVSLMCSYEERKDRPDPLYSVKWYRGVEQFYEYVPKKDPPVRVYELPNLDVDVNQSDKSTVVLKGVTKDTSGTFRCEVVGDKPHFETDEHAQNMTVFEVPEWGPEIHQEPQGNRVRPGDRVSARCMVGASDPPANIIWLINKDSPPPHASISYTVETSEMGRRLQLSVLEMAVTENSFRRGAMTVSCEVSLSNVFQKSANFTLIHADHPKPAEFGWFSSGSSMWFSLVMVEATIGALCLLLVC